ncbi:MAG: alkaline phosphatase family protein [Promethearchaeota archaeon]
MAFELDPMLISVIVVFGILVLIEAIPIVALALEFFVLVLLTQASPLLTIMIGTIAILIGSVISYSYTYLLSEKVPWIRKLLQKKKIERMTQFFNKRGDPLLIATRCIPFLPFRPMNFVCGATRYPWKKYFPITLFGAVVRVSIIVIIGQEILKLRVSLIPLFIGLFIVIIVIGVVVDRILSKIIAAESLESKNQEHPLIQPTSADPSAFLEKNYESKRLEIYAARIWNLLNEGKSFFLIFTFFIFALRLLIIPIVVFVSSNFPLATILSFEQFDFDSQALIWSILFAIPFLVLFIIFDFPLQYRAFLWVLLGVFILLFQYIDLISLLLILSFYFFFTVFLWGSVYYHFRVGTPLTNFTRFWKLVLTNPDSTSGNSLELLPKFLISLFLLTLFLRNPITNLTHILFIPYLIFLVVTIIMGVSSHVLYFRTIPKETGVHTTTVNNERLVDRIYVIVIDGCRKDRLEEANTPTIDHLRNEGTEYSNMRTTYPARTVVCFSSMFTGASKEKHGITSNLVVKSFFGRKGIKVESTFDLLEKNGMKGRMVAIAHLIDAFGEKIVRSVSAVCPNELIDGIILKTAESIIEKEDPELLVIQLISTDQTGHIFGSSSPEYLQKIEETDIKISEFLSWLKEKDKLKKSAIIIMADHGQSHQGIGAHGHWDKGEREVPFIMWGQSIKEGVKIDKEVRILDLAPTLSYLFGIPPPKESIGIVL